MQQQARQFFGLMLGGAIMVGGAMIGVSEAQTTERVSVDSTGVEGNSLSGALNGSASHAISADGRFVAFESLATNLVLGDTNARRDIFIHDRQTGQTTRVSVDSTGAEGNDHSFHPSLSADGRFMAFASFATNLVPDDTNGWQDIFVHDRQTGQTTRVSVDSTGVEGNTLSDSASISADGRIVAFESSATNLVQDDTNGRRDIFIHDRQTGQTTQVSVASDGTPGNQHSFRPSLSADGRLVTFESGASNLVPGDTNGALDIFVHDRQTGQTTRVSVATGGAQGNHSSEFPSLSADGRFIVFWSQASNLATGGGGILVHDRQTGETTRVGDGFFSPSISADGRFVAFASNDFNLVPGDTNGTMDIFVHDRQTGQTTRVSVATGGAQSDNLLPSMTPSLSADGRFVAFESLATNLVPGDTNGTQDIFVHDRGIVAPVPPTSLAASVLPSSRSVQVGTTATAFGLLINGGTTTATSCSIAPSTSIPATFSYQTTDPITNAPTGSPDTPVDIPAGASQTFVMSFTPTAAFSPTDVALNFSCTNTAPAPSTVGLNTLLLSASATPVPDIVALVATPTNDGIIHLPGATGGLGSTGVFVVASLNVGATGTITVTADTGTASLPLAITLCQTDTGTGACLAPPSSSVTTDIVANTTSSFGVFVEGLGPVPFDPGINRIFIRFKDTDSVTRGSTSVAVQTP